MRKLSLIDSAGYVFVCSVAFAVPGVEADPGGAAADAVVASVVASGVAVAVAPAVAVAAAAAPALAADVVAAASVWAAEPAAAVPGEPGTAAVAGASGAAPAWAPASQAVAGKVPASEAEMRTAPVGAVAVIAESGSAAAAHSAEGRQWRPGALNPENKIASASPRDSGPE